MPAVLVAVPVADRRSTTAQVLGNRFRELRAAIPDVGEPLERLERVADIMRIRKRSVTGPSISLIASGLVRAATALGVYGWYMRRQRYLHTVVTNLRGPGQPQTFCGAAIVEIVPLAVGGGGNVAVTFAALSYAGTLAVSVTADPDRLPELPHITAALQAELDELAHAGTPVSSEAVAMSTPRGEGPGQVPLPRSRDFRLCRRRSGVTRLEDGGGSHDS